METNAEIPKTVANQSGNWLRRFFVREDAVYDHYVSIGQAKSLWAKAFYLFMHLLPGILAWAFINVSLIYHAELRLTGCLAERCNIGG